MDTNRNAQPCPAAINRAELAMMGCYNTKDCRAVLDSTLCTLIACFDYNGSLCCIACSTVGKSRLASSHLNNTRADHLGSAPHVYNTGQPHYMTPQQAAASRHYHIKQQHGIHPTSSSSPHKPVPMLPSPGYCKDHDCRTTHILTMTTVGWVVGIAYTIDAWLIAQANDSTHGPSL